MRRVLPSKILPPNVLSGAAFRSALGFLLLFLIVAGAAGFIILRTTYAALDEEIRSEVRGEIGLLKDAYVAGGAKGLQNFIEAASHARTARYYVVTLIAPDGRVVAGNYDFEPAGLGWSTAEILADSKRTTTYLVYAEDLDGQIVAFGRPVRHLDVTVDALWRSMSIAGIVITLGVIAVGYGLSLGVSNKLVRMVETLDEVSRGNSEARLPVSASNDQIDQVSRQMNRHLDQLTDLMAAMRNTAVAIAHDLKSPMSRAYLLLQQATQEELPERRDEMLEQAQGELESLNAIFEAILRISRIESSRDQSAFAPLLLSEFAADIAQTYEPVVEGLGQSLHFLPSTTAERPVLGDRRMLSQLLVNLIENASRYSPQASSITVGVEDTGDAVALTVADTGPGIPPDRYQDVLKPFYRLEAERETPGSGLGLALVKATTVRHQAEIALSDNRPGLRVTIRFPPANA